MEKLYSVTELARDLGVTSRAIRFYEDQELISPQRAGNTRVYTHRDRARMILILRGKRLGFSLKEIKDFLDLYDADPDRVEQLQHLAAQLRSRIDLLEQQARAIETTLGELRELEAQTVQTLNSKNVRTH